MPSRTVLAQTRIEQRLALLVQAGEFFHRSLDIGQTLDNVARHAVQSFADLCIFDLIDERSKRVYVTSTAHRDPAMQPQVKNVEALLYNAEFRPHPVLEVMETGVPLFLPEIDETLIDQHAASREHARYMRTLGYRSKIVVPVTANGRMFGALTFVMTADLRFDDGDLELASELGRRAGIAVANAQQLRREHNVAKAVQQAFLTRHFPVHETLRFYALYRVSDTEDESGGDWYDAFETKNGAVVVTIGHVTGRGMDSARTMVQLREAIRVGSLIADKPGGVLEIANDALLLDRCETVASAFVGIIDPASLVLRYASAGHVTPLLRRRDGEVEALTADSSTLASLQAPPFIERTTALSPGSLLVLFTYGSGDGKDADIDSAMSAAVASEGVVHAADPARYFDRVARHALCAPDDFAAIVVEVPHHRRWCVDAGDARVAYGIKDDFLREVGRMAGDEADLDACQLIFAELIGNSARHAPGPLSIALEAGSDLVLHFIDEGPGFDYDPKLPVDIWAESGRGLFLISRLAADVTVTRLPIAGSHVAVTLPVEIKRQTAA